MKPSPRSFRTRRGDYAIAPTLEFLSLRALPGVEYGDAKRYARVLKIGDVIGWVEIGMGPKGLMLTLSENLAPHLRPLVANVRGAFAVEPLRRRQIEGRHIAIVDDVLTTGATAAEMSRTLLQAGARSVHLWVLARTPAGRWGDPADFGGIAVYLASDASAYTTGEQFVIDGGYTLW